MSKQWTSFAVLAILGISLLFSILAFPLDIFSWDVLAQTYPNPDNNQPSAPLSQPASVKELFTSGAGGGLTVFADTSSGETIYRIWSNCQNVGGRTECEQIIAFSQTELGLQPTDEVVELLTETTESRWTATIYQLSFKNGIYAVQANVYDATGKLTSDDFRMTFGK